jgi:hypothetical protein
MTMRRAVITWTAVFALLLAAFAASVITLNSQLYSAHGFVRGYLSALERGDSAAALEVPGVSTSNDASRALLTDGALGALGGLDAITLVSDVAGADGTHTVTMDYELLASGAGDEASEKKKARTEFVVTRSGTRLGLFPTWRFVASPVSTMSITVLHDQDFTVNGVDVTTTAEPDSAATFLVFTPGVYVLGHESSFLTADAVVAEATTVGEIMDASVDVQANSEFTAEVQQNVSTYLAGCAEQGTTQKILMPAGCPFGQSIRNKVTSDPVWSMVVEPSITIVPGDTPGTWAVPATPATAHLVVDVQSLFDGTISTFDRDVPFTVQYLITFEGNQMVITAVYE